MVSIIYFFWLLVALFALIGAMRGWAKELLVTFSMILALFLITLIENYVEVFKVLMTNTDETSIKNVFWIRSVIVMTLAFFGYQTTAILERFVGGKLSRDKLQDLLLGAFIGEYISSTAGLGHLILVASGLFDISLVLTGVLFLAIIALILNFIISKIEIPIKKCIVKYL